MDFSPAEKYWLDEQIKRYTPLLYQIPVSDGIVGCEKERRYSTNIFQIEFPYSRDFLRSESIGSKKFHYTISLDPTEQDEGHTNQTRSNVYIAKPPINEDNSESDETIEEGVYGRVEREPREETSIMEIIESLPSGDFKEKDINYETPYWEWRALLQNGYSLVLYGLGSKFEVLEFFQSKFLRDGLRCIITASYEKFDFKAFISSLMHTLNLPKEENIDKKKFIPRELSRYLGTTQRIIYIIIHNLDSTFFHSLHKEFAILASFPRVHLVCSVDHIRFTLLWDSLDVSKFNFIFRQCSSRSDYRHELLESWKNGFPPWFITEEMETKTKEIQFDMIIAALTHNHKRLIRIIAEKQLENPSQGVPEESIYFSDSAFIIGMDRQKLNKLLVELISYQILKKFISSHGKMSLLIPAEREHLEKLCQIE